LLDPSVDQAALAQLAGSRPDLHAAILAHPNCYPELADWIKQTNPAAAAQRVAADPVATVPVVAADPVAAAPVVAQVQPVVAAPVAAPTPDFATPAPAYATPAFQPAPMMPAAQFALPAATKPKIGWAPFVLLAGVVIAAISLFLPLVSASGFGMTLTSGSYFNWTDSDGSNIKTVGIMWAVMLAIVLLLTILAIAVRSMWARVLAGVFGLLVGLVFLAFAIYMIYEIGAAVSGVGMFGISGSPGLGLIVFTVAAVVMVVASIGMFIKPKSTAPVASLYAPNFAA